MKLDIITDVAKRVFNEVKTELQTITLTAAMIALTAGWLLAMFLPVWMVLPAILGGWAVVIHDQYREALDDLLRKDDKDAK